MNFNNEENPDYLLKIVVVGNSNVGKTNIISRFCKDSFSSQTKATIGVDFTMYSLKVLGKKVKIQFWDTAGQEKYRAMSTAYYKGAHGAILVYDISNRESFFSLGLWLSEIKNQSNSVERVILLGNKNDLAEERAVSKKQGIVYAEERELKFYEISAKLDGEGIKKAIHEYIEDLVRDMGEKGEDERHRETIEFRSVNRSITMSNINAKKQGKKGLCC